MTRGRPTTVDDLYEQMLFSDQVASFKMANYSVNGRMLNVK